MNLFLLLVLAHLLGDYPLQTNWIYRQKFRSWSGGLWHAAILFLCFAVILSPYLANWRVAALVATISFIHYLQDYLKIEIVNKRKKMTAFSGLLFDQLLHFLFLMGAAYWANSLQLEVISGNLISSILYSDPVLIYLIVLLSATFVINTVSHVKNFDKSKSEFRRDWRGIFIRGGIATFVFGVIWLVTAAYLV
ncbi:MAG: DUF3307 domain-containing protein [Patescibacteria group bacterium]